MTQAETDLDALIRANAERLLADAELLLAHDRFASACAVGVLSLEETGKLILRKWQNDPDIQNDVRRFGFHKVKQAIVGALYLSKAAWDARHSHLGTATRESLREAIARAMYESEHRDYIKASFDGVIDKTKQCAFYVDEWGVSIDATPFGFQRHDAERAIEEARYAIALSGDDDTARVAKAIYRSHRAQR